MDGDEDWSARYEAAARTWPTLRVSLPEFRAHVEGRWPPPIDDPQIALSDLFLACGCALGRPEALAAFEQTCCAEIDAVVKRLGRLAPPLDDARQLVLERLLASSPPKIAEFRGRGSLKSWVRVVALRALLNHRQRLNGKEQLLDEVADLERLLPATDGPELVLMKQHYGEHVRAALREGISSLDARDRTLLRLAFIEGASIDAIGAVYGVHRATAARWVQFAHKNLTSRVHRLLREQLRLTPAELESALRFIASSFDTSLSRYLVD